MNIFTDEMCEQLKLLLTAIIKTKHKNLIGILELIHQDIAYGPYSYFYEYGPPQKKEFYLKSNYKTVSEIWNADVCDSFVSKFCKKMTIDIVDIDFVSDIDQVGFTSYNGKEVLIYREDCNKAIAVNNEQKKDITTLMNIIYFFSQGCYFDNSFTFPEDLEFV